jgi:hypothetical protein
MQLWIAFKDDKCSYVRFTSKFWFEQILLTNRLPIYRPHPKYITDEVHRVSKNLAQGNKGNICDNRIKLSNKTAS